MRTSVAVVTLLVAYCSTCIAAPNWISVRELAEKAMETQDPSYMASAFFRCSSLQDIGEGLVTRSFGDSQAEVANALKEAAEKSRNLALSIERTLRENRGAAPLSETDEVDMVIKAVGPMMSEYVRLMNDNELRTGDRFDESLTQELSFCRQLVESL